MQLRAPVVLLASLWAISQDCVKVTFYSLSSTNYR
jgi:hypothetical protein